MVGDGKGTEALVLAGRRRVALTRNPVARAAGVLAAAAAVALAAVLVVVFAATLALVLILSAAALAAAAAAWRLGRRGGGRSSLGDAAGASGSITSRFSPRLDGGRVGHSWVAYGWDRQA